jgi:predicted nucleic acid-binding protein
VNGLVVVDASLAVKWLINEVYTDEAFALARSWVIMGTQPVAPYLLPVEGANVLYRRAVQQDLSLQAAIRLLGEFISAGIELMEPGGFHQRALNLADSLRQGAVYDAHYLALADMIGCELWTADERFFRAANTLFPDIHWIGEI